MSQQYSKLKIISRPTSSRSKHQPNKAQPNSNVVLIRCEIGIQAEDQKTLLACQSSKTLYKQKLEQCEERLGEENEYLRGYMMDLTLRLHEKEDQIAALMAGNQRLKNDRDGLENEVNSLKQLSKTKQKEYEDVIKQFKKQNQQCIGSIKSLKQMMNIRQKCISELRSSTACSQQSISKLTDQNQQLKVQIQDLMQSRQRQSQIEIQPLTQFPSFPARDTKSEKRRAKSNFDKKQLKQLVISEEKQNMPELSPKEAARMDVLLEQFNQLKVLVTKGNISSNTAFRLITLVQYLRQTLNKKSLENAELKENKKYNIKNDPRLSQTIDRYQRTIFQCRQQIESLQCEIRILKDQRNESKDQSKPLSNRNKSTFNLHQESRRNSNGSISNRKEFRNQYGISTAEFERSINRQQENSWKFDHPFCQTQNISYREIAKKQLIQKLDSGSSIYNDFRAPKSYTGGLSERKHSVSINQSQADKYNFVYDKSDLSEFLKKRNSLITYMTLVVKITQIVQRTLKNQTYQIITPKDILIMTCQSSCPDSMKMKCDIKICSDEQIDSEYFSPEYTQPQDELMVMWSIGIVFKKIFESIQTDDVEEKELFSNIVKPQFDKIIESLVVQDPKGRMNMSQFKEMLTKLS